MPQSPRRLSEIAGAFLRLGCYAFGGPVAHLGYLREEFVQRRAWLDEREYGELVALCQFLPGPASSQVVYGLGYKRAGFWGGVLASLGFLLPSALLMLGFSLCLSSFGFGAGQGWLHGLKLAALAVVAQAVLAMGRSMCPDLPRLVLGGLAAACALLLPGYLGQVLAIGVGAFAGLGLGGGETPTAAAVGKVTGHRWALAALGLYAGLLFLLPVLAELAGRGWLTEFNHFYRAGALVFGGGHVILPLLREGTVGAGALSDGVFLAGYGAAQAVPGPLFSFAAYLGAAMHTGTDSLWHGLLCLAAIYLPALLLVGGALPYWELLRCRPKVQAAMRGTNAAVVGLLLAALITPVASQSLTRVGDGLIALLLFLLLERRRWPSWSVVLLGAAMGLLLC